MPESKHKILVVDDEPSVRNSLAMILAVEGYEVATAEDGFDALLQLKQALPDVIVSDLNMPRMSGFELLSVVRRRFPHIPVVATSGAFHGESVPGGVIADAFYAKGQHKPTDLSKIVADLIRTATTRASAHAIESAPVWIPRNGKTSNGIPYVVLTCTDCLRSFPLTVAEGQASPTTQETPCLFCSGNIRYIIDFSLSVVSPQKDKMKAASIGGKTTAA